MSAPAYKSHNNSEPKHEAAEVIFGYLRAMIYDPRNAKLDPKALPDEFVGVGKGLLYLNQVLSETRALASALAEGNLNCPLPPPSNEIAAPLKNLHASLKHLTWQAQMVAKGNYNQHIDFMGDFSQAFNDMIAQLRQREVKNVDEKARLKSFMATMSHEIRTPMNAVIGMSELALREEMSDQAREYTLIVKQAGTNLLSIINDILDFSKIESGRLEIIEDEYSLADLTSDVINIVKVKAKDKQLQFVSRIDPGLPYRLYGDVVRLRQVMLNILSNAVKYTEKGRVLFSIAGQEAEHDVVVLTISVKDTGRGIKKEDMATLFEEFSQFDKEANRSIEGTGLGLAITKSLVSAMNGEIRAQSEYGKGSTFTVSLPQKIVSREATTTTSATSGTAGVGFIAPSARVLVVDDVDTNLKVTEGLMRPYQMQVDLCSGGKQAIEAVQSTAYDLVLMDHMMPGMDGLEATEYIRRLGGGLENLTIVAFTANATSGAKDAFLESGFDDYLTKPIEVVQLDAMLERWIPEDKRKPPEPDQSAPEAPAQPSFKINGLDVIAGIAMTGGTVESYLQTLAIFCTDAVRKISEIKSSLESGNLKMYITCVHAFKGALGSIGAGELSKTAGRLEDAGRKERLELIEERNPEFLADMEALLKNIREVIEKDSQSASSQPVDAAQLKTLLVQLRDALQVYDIDAMNEAAKGLQGFTKAAEIGPDIDTILQYKLTGEYESAEPIIELLLSRL